MSEWPQARLGDVATFVNGRAFKPDEWGEVGIPIIRIQNLTNPDAIANYYAGELDDKHSVNDGDLLVSWSATLDVFEWYRGPAALNQHIFKVVGYDGNVEKKYLFYALKAAMDEMRSKTHGATMKHITKGLFEATQIPLPPRIEQQRVVKLLDGAETIRRLRAKADQRTADLIPALFHQMFGDPMTNPMGWPTAPLIRAADKVVDCPHSTPSWQSSGVTCVRTSNLGFGEWVWNDHRFVSREAYRERTKRLEPKEGDIILSREGTVGIAAIVPSDMQMCMGQRLVLVRPDNIKTLPDFLLQHLLYLLAPDNLTKLFTGSTSKHLNVRDLKQFEIMLPPMELQQEFADRVNAMRGIGASQQEVASAVGRIMKSLLASLFPNEIGTECLEAEV